jgi:hypothetical protein
MYSKSVNPRIDSVLEVVKILAAYGLVAVGVFFYNHIKACILYYAVLFLIMAFWTRSSRITKNHIKR